MSLSFENKIEKTNFIASIKHNKASSISVYIMIIISKYFLIVLLTLLFENCYTN
jgi:hypothetical protein